MVNEETFFSRFVYDGPFVNRDCLRKPFERDGFIYASNSMFMVRVAKNLCEKAYDQSENPKLLPCFPAPECNYKLELKELIEVLKSIPRRKTVAVSGKDAECDECDGDGRVEWTYEDSDGEEHQEYFDCPICRGKGKVSTKVIGRYERAVSINGTSFNAGLLSLMAEAINDAGLKSVIIACPAREGHPMLIQFQEGVYVIIMPTGEKPFQEINLKSNTDIEEYL